METEYYTCEFCQTKFKPKRRKVQKFCSATCRSKHYYHKNIVSSDTSITPETKIKPPKTKIEEMSLPGIANAATALLLIQLLNKLLTKLENQPATKKDIDEIKKIISTRYFQVSNMQPRFDGAIPYFDLSTRNIIYRK